MRRFGRWICCAAPRCGSDIALRRIRRGGWRNKDRGQTPERKYIIAADKGKKEAAKPAVENDEKRKALAIALAGIEKDFGKGAVIRMGDREVHDIEVISTGCMDLDMALGVGGGRNLRP